MPREGRPRPHSAVMGDELGRRACVAQSREREFLVPAGYGIESWLCPRECMTLRTLFRPSEPPFLLLKPPPTL